MNEKSYRIEWAQHYGTDWALVKRCEHTDEILEVIEVISGPEYFKMNLNNELEQAKALIYLGKQIKRVVDSFAQDNKSGKT